MTWKGSEEAEMEKMRSILSKTGSQGYEGFHIIIVDFYRWMRFSFILRFSGNKQQTRYQD
jgi:hypothetical protein